MLHAPTGAWAYYLKEPWNPADPEWGTALVPFAGHGPDKPVHDIMSAWFLSHATSASKFA